MSESNKKTVKTPIGRMHWKSPSNVTVAQNAKQKGSATALSLKLALKHVIVYLKAKAGLTLFVMRVSLDVNSTVGRTWESSVSTDMGGCISFLRYWVLQPNIFFDCAKRFPILLGRSMFAMPCFWIPVSSIHSIVSMQCM